MSKKKFILIVLRAMAGPKYSCNKLRPRVAPMVKASAHVALSPKSVVCLSTNKLARMQTRQIKETSASLPKYNAPSVALLMKMVWSKKISSLVSKCVGIKAYGFLLLGLMLIGVLIS